VADPLLTLTTDFGYDSPYVAAMKGVILSLNPLARIVDLSHAIPPQDVRHAAFFLSGAVPYFPEGTLHVIVIDPGVGSERSMLYVELAGQRLLSPDNGVWTLLAGGRVPARVIQLHERRFWRPAVSQTFHGRDMLAPVAAHLSLGLDPVALGPPVENWVRISPPRATPEGNRITGQVVFVDHFGNLVSNIPGDILGATSRVHIEGQEVPLVCAYSAAPAGSLVAIVSSWGTLEIAVTQGSAADRLRSGRDTPVLVEGIL
jgi:S-adenosylmethionine hydrolase